MMWEKLYQLLSFIGWPFVIAAAFHYTDWMGWPALLIGGMFWLGTCCLIYEEGR